MNVIKYFTIETTHSLTVEFGNEKLPENFSFVDEGDEWDCRCISDTGKYENVESFIDIKNFLDFKCLEIKEEALETEEALKEELAEKEEEADRKKTAKEMFREMKEQKAAMKAFMDSVKGYWAKEEDMERIR